MARDTTETDAEPVATGTRTLLFFALVWLATTGYTVHATITGSGQNLSGTLGAAAAALPGVIAAMLVAGVIFGVLAPNLVKVFGDGEVARTRLALGQSLVTGLAAAISTVLFLRVQRNRVLWYLVGGALPGVVLLGAAWLTRAGGSAVAQLVHGFRPESQALVEVSDSARLRHALIVVTV